MDALYIANIVTPDRVSRQGGAGFSGKPDGPLAPSAVSRIAHRVWGGTERVMSQGESLEPKNR